mmetsp:Transcript_5363/g.10831  ORF Transcript_5363/g.10831 Transcript_5363/m.10831 type:complete len:297 (-) Transcript_5363:354-1244(-)
MSGVACRSPEGTLTVALASSRMRTVSAFRLIAAPCNGARAFQVGKLSCGVFTSAPASSSIRTTGICPPCAAWYNARAKSSSSLGLDGERDCRQSATGSARPAAAMTRMVLALVFSSAASSPAVLPTAACSATRGTQSRMAVMAPLHAARAEWLTVVMACSFDCPRMLGSNVSRISVRSAAKVASASLTSSRGFILLSIVLLGTKVRLVSDPTSIRSGMSLATAAPISTRHQTRKNAHIFRSPAGIETSPREAWFCGRSATTCKCMETRTILLQAWTTPTKSRSCACSAFSSGVSSC